MTKIAFVSDDGEKVSQHFGKSPFYYVVTLQEDGSQSTEKRAKWYHRPDDDHSQPHNHNSMFEVISDCQVLVVGGMGHPAHRAAVEQGLQVVLTGEKSITSALDAYRNGSLLSDERRVHHHH